MTISELIAKLQELQSEHGDLKVIVVRPHVWQESSWNSIPGAMDGGAGYSREWYGTVREVRQCEQYPNQAELIPVK